ncbi:MAG: DUF4340 domain-containing protein [Lachnospiraceae bacterium]|nr:DUF4340 domain-containing protein [Lachnospiraceae bacterium]
MKKQKTQLIIMAVILVALIAAYFGVQQYNKIDAAKADDEDTAQYTALQIDTDKVTDISYTYNGNTVHIVKDGDSWYNADDRTMVLDETKVNPFLYAVKDMKSANEIKDVTDLSEYGLDQPTHVVTVTTDTDTHEIEFGALNEMLSIYYYSIDGGSTVYTAQESTATTFEQAVEDLVAESETETETETVTETESTAETE